VTLRIHDTAQQALVPFEAGPVVRMYVCGITPYDSTHLGHAATYITYDLLTRRLEELGHEVRMVRNVTDVDDSILPKARELGIDYLELADAELARFQADMDALGRRPLAAETGATEAIDGMIQMVGRLLDSGHAYLTHGTAYFDVSTFPRYGELSHYPEEHMVRLARARGGNPDDPHRRAPLDFILWQPSSPANRRGGASASAARLAPRVLGDVDGRARPHARPARWRHRSGLPAPRVRDCAGEASPDKRSRGTGCTRRWSATRARDVEVTRQPRFHQRPAEGRRPARHPTGAHASSLPGRPVARHRPRRGQRTPAPSARRRRARTSRPTPCRRVRTRSTPISMHRALEALDDLASAILSDGSDPTGPAVLHELRT
jgi:hypothetical protein